MRIFNFILTRTKNVLPTERLSSARDLILIKCNYVVDIGANDGQWISDIKHRGYNGPALSIEPLKENYKKLVAQNLKNVITLNCAVGNMNGEIYINKASNNGLSSSILELDSSHKEAAPNVKFINKEKVKILKLSKILAANKHQNIYVKIDTQGYEYEVLKSISKSNLNRIIAFEIETNLVSTYKNCVLIEDVIKFLRNKGFKPLRIENGFGVPNFGQQLQVDILFVRAK